MSRPTLLILAGTTHEAYAYCARMGLPTRDRRVVMRRSQIIGFRTAIVHALPSFHAAAHRHSILAGLKHLKVEWHDVEMPEPAPVDQGDGMGEQLTLPEGLEDLGHSTGPSLHLEPNLVQVVTDGQHDTAESLRAAAEAEITEELDGQQAGTPEPSEDAAPAPRAKRRSRCKACGELKDLEGHDCPMDPASNRDDSMVEPTPEAVTAEAPAADADDATEEIPVSDGFWS